MAQQQQKNEQDYQEILLEENMEKLVRDLEENLLKDDDDDSEQSKPKKAQKQQSEHLKQQHLEFPPEDPTFDWAFAAKLQARLEQQLNGCKPFEKIQFGEMDSVIDKHLKEINRNAINYEKEMKRLFPKEPKQPKKQEPKNSFL